MAVPLYFQFLAYLLDDKAHTFIGTLSHGWLMRGATLLILASFLALVPLRVMSQTSVEAKAVLLENSEAIKDAGSTFGVSPRLICSVIYAEHVLNYSWEDKSLDVPLAKAGMNTSIGLGQVKVLTALWIEEQLNDSLSLYFLGNERKKYLSRSASRSEVIVRLSEGKWNCYYVAADLAMILNRWSKAGVSIQDRVDILATLYSAGVEKSGKEVRKPHLNPKSNGFGECAREFYDSTVLIDAFPRR